MNHKYRKKPVEVEAFQLTYGVAKGNESIPDWGVNALREGGIVIHLTDGIHGSQYAFIDTLEGKMRADAEDWIIRGVEGEIYPCKPHIFKATYNKVNE